MKNPFKQNFRTKDGDWDYGELHYFSFGLTSGILIGFLLALGYIWLYNIIL